MIEIAKGAEATVYDDKDTIVKVRDKKGYRLNEIDETLRKLRSRSEAKILSKLSIPHPKLISYDEKTFTIIMEKISGVKVRDAFSITLCSKIGKHLAQMHNEGVIHGDLTTSNMILGKDKEVYFIDFGLSYFSLKVEDKAVDLHLLKEAFESKHFKQANKAFEEVIKGYKSVSKDFDEVISRFDVVEKRGRNKH